MSRKFWKSVSKLSTCRNDILTVKRNLTGKNIKNNEICFLQTNDVVCKLQS